jgi:hypothetical protein
MKCDFFVESSRKKINNTKQKARKQSLRQKSFYNLNYVVDLKKATKICLAIEAGSENLELCCLKKHRILLLILLFWIF